jgi:hypothetical protein
MNTPIRTTSHITISVLPWERDASSTLRPDEKRVTNEDLGSKTIAGIPVVGARTVTTIAAGNIGNNQEIVIRHEQWTSPDLQLIVAESDDNPFSETRSYEITSFARNAPPETLFQAPENLPLQPRVFPPSGLPSMGIAPPLTDGCAEKARLAFRGPAHSYFLSQRAGTWYPERTSIVKPRARPEPPT